MGTAIRRVTVGSALLGANDPVLRTSLGLFRDRAVEMHVVHVYDARPPLEDAYVKSFRPSDERRRDEGSEVAQRLEVHLKGIDPDATAVLHAVEGTASERLIQVARRVRADLIVVGATRQDRVLRRYLGTTAQGVVSRARQPVLVLRQPVLRPLRGVVFPSDLSELSSELHERGLEMLDALFDGDDPEVRSLLVLPRPTPGAATATSSFWEFAEERQADLLRKQRQRAAPVRGRIREGDPVEEIVREIREWPANLLVLGTHARPGRHRDLGRVCGATLREASCNVLVIPPRVGAAPGKVVRGLSDR